MKYILSPDGEVYHLRRNRGYQSICGIEAFMGYTARDTGRSYVLTCFCKPKYRCHGDIIKRYVEDLLMS